MAAMGPRHARYRLLAVTVALVALVPLPLAWAIRDPAQLAGAYFGWGLALWVAAAGGAVIAATTFREGEPQRPGWLLLGGAYLAFAAIVLFVGPRTAHLLPPDPAGSPWAIFVSNVLWSALSVAGYLVLSGAWRGSGLDPTSPTAHVVSRVIAFGIAAVLAGPDLVERFPVALQGDPVAIADCLTDVLDGALFFVAVPVLHAARALGGGIVAWPWLFLTASVAGWLGYDAIAVYGEAIGLDPRGIRVGEEVMRTLGGVCTLTAGMAQRWVMLDTLDR